MHSSVNVQAQFFSEGTETNMHSSVNTGTVHNSILFIRDGYYVQHLEGSRPSPFLHHGIVYIGFLIAPGVADEHS